MCHNLSARLRRKAAVSMPLYQSWLEHIEMLFRRLSSRLELYNQGENGDYHSWLGKISNYVPIET